MTLRSLHAVSFTGRDRNSGPPHYVRMVSLRYKHTLIFVHHQEGYANYGARFLQYRKDYAPG